MRKILSIFLFLPLFTQALTPVFTCGFECAGVSQAGDHWNQASGSPTYSTTTFRSGLRSVRFNPTASQYQLLNNLLSSNVMVTRMYVKFTLLPNSDNAIHEVWDGASGTLPGVFFKSSDSKLYAGSDNGGGSISFGATGVSVTTGQWYLIDTKVNTSTNPWTVDVSVDGVACGQLTKALTGVTLTRLIIGNGAANTTSDFFIDDLIVSYTSGDFPIGAGHVVGFVPASDGTHTSTTTHTVKGTAASPSGGGSITSATTDAFNWVNARPIGGGATDATRLINAQTAASTEYVEVGIEQTTETTAPRAVEVLVVDQQATTAVGDMHIKVNDNGTETVVLDRTSVAGVITDRYTTKQFATMPTGGSAWTLVRFKALKLRFGYSTDATPDQYWRGAMVEAEFTDAAATVPGTPGDKRFSSMGVGLLDNERSRSDKSRFPFSAICIYDIGAGNNKSGTKANITGAVSYTCIKGINNTIGAGYINSNSLPCRIPCTGEKYFIIGEAGSAGRNQRGRYYSFTGRFKGSGDG